MGVPPLKIPRALRKITETFARALAGQIDSSPSWTDFEWIVARAVAAMHGISPLLSNLVHWDGGPGWRQFLQHQRMHTAHRHARMNELLQRVDRKATEEGIPVLALKGTALHAMGLYAIGDRPMADIDLLVRPVDAKRMATVLELLGFRQSTVSFKERVFTPLHAHPPDELGEHSNNDLKIDLHERICERLPLCITDATEDIFPSQPRAGLNGYPSKSSLMIHLLLHAAGSMPTKVLRLLQLHDIALLSSQMSASDWKAILDTQSVRRLWWAFPPLKLTSRYYPSIIPGSVLSTLASECPLLLRNIAAGRKLFDVSYSYPWVDAFPGIEWSRSLPEALEYAANRLWPSANLLAARKHVAKSETWAHSEWSQLSQSRRVLRWIASRPTRPVTMHAVFAAIAQAS